jgi:hypothetical protein
MHHALLFIPADDPNPRKWMVTLWTYCMRRCYEPAAVAHNWCDVLKLWQPGMRVVVARRDHVDWLEVVSERPPEADAQGVPLAQRRVRRQR